MVKLEFKPGSHWDSFPNFQQTDLDLEKKKFLLQSTKT